MLPAGIRRRLTTVHRWLTVIFTPILVPVLVSAAVLAVLPFFAGNTVAPQPVAWLDVLDTLHVADPQGQASAIRIDSAGATMTVVDSSGERAFDLTTHAPTAQVPTPSAAEDMDYWQRQHTHPAGLPDALVVFSSLALTILAVTGLFLAPPRRARGVRGLHILAGWTLLPLILLTPVTGVMLGFHVAGDAPPRINRSAPPVSLGEALELARGGNVDLTALRSAESFHGVATTVTVGEGLRESRFVVSGDGTVARLGDGGWVLALHQGSWADPWSRLVNLLSVIALAGLNLSGLWMWGRRVVTRSLRRRAVPA